MADVTRKQVLEALRAVRDPDLGRDIVSLEFVKEIKICGGAVKAVIELTTPACPARHAMQAEAQRLIGALPGVTEANVEMKARTVGRTVTPEGLLADVKNLVAIGSGKGGVGKSTVTVNLALALAATGATVGILDADIYGPSIPGLLGLKARPLTDADGRLVPPECLGLKVMSVGMLVGDDAPTIWRGPIASRLLQQFLAGVAWGELDYLILDLPPGTGDVQLTLAQTAPLNGAAIVTTPQDVAVRIARKGLRMFQQVRVPVLGVIENMSGAVFGTGGGEAAARSLGVPFLGRIPLDAELVASSDQGRPLVHFQKDCATAQAFLSVAQNLAAQLSIANIHEHTVKNRPQEIHLLDQTPPKIVWEDGRVTIYEARALRLACPCASCQEELTGAPLLRPEDVPQDIRLAEVRPVGRYGLNLAFSDGHSFGIYTFDRLRECGQEV